MRKWVECAWRLLVMKNRARGDFNKCRPEMPRRLPWGAIISAPHPPSPPPPLSLLPQPAISNRQTTVCVVRKRCVGTSEVGIMRGPVFWSVWEQKYYCVIIRNAFLVSRFLVFSFCPTSRHRGNHLQVPGPRCTTTATQRRFKKKITREHASETRMQLTTCARFPGSAKRDARKMCKVV